MTELYTEWRSALPATLLSLLDLPSIPVRYLENSPLAFTVCQVKFPRELSIADDVFVAAFQRAVKGQYPLAEKVPEIGISIALGAALAPTQSESRSFHWQFADKESTWKLDLSQDSFSLETRQYHSFGDFLERLALAMDALIQHIQPSLISRIGLRYINEIRPRDMSCQVAINPQVLGAVAIPQFSPNVAQSIQELLIRFDDGHGVNLRHGLLPQGTTVQPRPGDESPTGSFYLLDIDAFRQFPTPGGLTADASAVCEYVDTFNKVVYSIFRMATTEEYINSLGEREWLPLKS